MSGERYGLFHQPKNTLPRIESIYAFVTVDPADGNEGVCSTTMDGVILPLIAADESRLVVLRQIAQQIADMSDLEIKLVKFTQREEIEDIQRSAE